MNHDPTLIARFHNGTTIYDHFNDAGRHARTLTLEIPCQEVTSVYEDQIRIVQPFAPIVLSDADGRVVSAPVGINSISEAGADGLLWLWRDKNGVVTFDADGLKVHFSDLTVRPYQASAGGDRHTNPSTPKVAFIATDKDGDGREGTILRFGRTSLNMTPAQIKAHPLARRFRMSGDGDGVNGYGYAGWVIIDEDWETPEQLWYWGMNDAGYTEFYLYDSAKREWEGPIFG